MKKLISLLLCLALFLPVLAMAETTETEAPVLSTVDFGPFTMGLGDSDVYQVADTLTSNTLYAIIYVDYDPTATTYETINVVYSEDDIPGEITLVGGIQKYAELVLNNAKSQYSSMGIAMSDEQVLSAIFENNMGVTITYSVLDYTGAGIELQSPVYQMQVFYCSDDAGSFLFTLTAASLDRLMYLANYMDYVEFK